MGCRPPLFRRAGVRGRIDLIGPALITPAGGRLSKAELKHWINKKTDALGPVIEVYIEQLCYYVNLSRNLISEDGTTVEGSMRAMLSVPPQFYETIEAIGPGAAEGSDFLRRLGISPEEFAQLEYFFMPCEHGGNLPHSNLIVISPRNHTIEIVDSDNRHYRALGAMFWNMIVFLIHELGQLAGPGPWMFLHSQGVQQQTGTDCGNYTCLFAKALALYQPLAPDTNLGQLPMGENQTGERTLRFRVAHELLLGQWTAVTHPVGNQPPAWRHGPLGPGSEPQHRLFWNAQEQDLTPGGVSAHRSRTGRWDHILTKVGLKAWCVAQQPPFVKSGRLIPRMRGHTMWARAGDGQHFRTMIEHREADILNGLFP